MTEIEVRDYLCDMGYDDTIIFTAPNYADAFVGVSTDGIAIYDYEKMVESLIINDGMTDEEAREWIDYNCIGAHIENGPMIINVGNAAYEHKEVN